MLDITCLLIVLVLYRKSASAGGDRSDAGVPWERSVSDEV